MMELQLALLLRRQLAELNKNPVEGFSAGLIDDNDLYLWKVLIIGPPDTLYEGGVFKAHLTFPKDYPLWPPKMNSLQRFGTQMLIKMVMLAFLFFMSPGRINMVMRSQRNAGYLSILWKTS